METDIFLELDYPFLHISALDDIYIKFGAIQVFLTYLLLKHKSFLRQDGHGCTCIGTPRRKEN